MNVDWKGIVRNAQTNRNSTSNTNSGGSSSKWDEKYTCMFFDENTFSANISEVRIVQFNSMMIVVTGYCILIHRVCFFVLCIVLQAELHAQQLDIACMNNNKSLYYINAATIAACVLEFKSPDLYTGKRSCFYCIEFIGFCNNSLLYAPLC